MSKAIPNTTPRVVLASRSPWRREVALRVFPQVDVVESRVDEQLLGDRSKQTAEELVVLLAEAKGRKVAAELSPPAECDTLVLSADQVLRCNGAILEKPRSPAELRQNYRNFALYGVETVGAVSLTSARTGETQTALEHARVGLAAALSESSLDELASQATPYECSGGLQIENPLVAGFVRIESGDFDTVRGLSAKTVERLATKMKAAAN